jgi:hypothetical protein
MNVNDPRWSELRGGYRVPYDPRPALDKLRANVAAQDVWSELCQQLHHQGDVGEASYAALPILVQVHRERGVPDWNTYALAATIELCRKSGKNPDVPAWLRPDYDAAWAELLELALSDLRRASDSTTLRSIMGAIAVARDEYVVGRVLVDFTSDELEEMVEKYMK